MFYLVFSLSVNCKALARLNCIIHIKSEVLNVLSVADIRVDWETYNIDQNDCKLVDVVVAYGDAFPLKDADGNDVLSGALRLSEVDVPTAREEASTPDSEGTSAFLESVTVSILTRLREDLSHGL